MLIIAANYLLFGLLEWVSARTAADNSGKAFCSMRG
jgi:hypothetical protein